MATDGDDGSDVIAGSRRIIVMMGNGLQEGIRQLPALCQDGAGLAVIDPVERPLGLELAAKAFWANPLALYRVSVP